MALNYRSPVVVEPQGPASAAVIFMHGLGGMVVSLSISMGVWGERKSKTLCLSTPFLRLVL